MIRVSGNSATASTLLGVGDRLEVGPQLDRTQVALQIACASHLLSRHPATALGKSLSLRRSTTVAAAQLFRDPKVPEASIGATR